MEFIRKSYPEAIAIQGNIVWTKTHVIVLNEDGPVIELLRNPHSDWLVQNNKDIEGQLCLFGDE